MFSLLPNGERPFMAMIIPAAAFTFFLAIFIRRVVFSKLRGVPGPLLAKLTDRWIWYHDLNGTAHLRIEELHQKYGKLVRIGPDEVSFKDAELYSGTVYKSGTNYLKHEFYRQYEVGPETMFTTTDPKSHKTLHRLVSSGFSRKSLLDMEPIIWERAEQMCAALDKMFVPGDKTVDLVNLYRCLAIDVISTLSFGRPIGALQMDMLRVPIFQSFNQFDFILAFFRGYTLFGRNLAFMFPYGLLKVVPFMFSEVEKILRTLNIHDLKPNTLLRQMVDTGERIGHKVDEEQIRATGVSYVFAGTDTTAFTLALGTWAILRDERVRTSLQQELDDAWKAAANDPSTTRTHPSMTKLEALPYLRACVKESLRFATATSGRLPRVVPAEGLTYEGYDIPAGTMISSNSWLNHFDESVFADAHSFVPERWLGAKDDEGLRLREKHFTPFSDGTRKCAGINIADAELYIGLGSIIRSYKAKEFVDKELRVRRILTPMMPEGLKVVLERI